jgi:hypothetical protein
MLKKNRLFKEKTKISKNQNNNRILVQLHLFLFCFLSLFKYSPINHQINPRFFFSERSIPNRFKKKCYFFK